MKIVITAFLSFLSLSSFAQDIKLNGTVDKIIHLPSATPAKAASFKHVALLNIELSDKARQKIQQKAQASLNEKIVSTTHAEREVQLGMGDVPVLDQGGYGSCVTFANTAAMDAALNKGDYISQLCSLQLGRYLEKNAYIPSGWNGSWGSIVLNQLTTFGWVSKTKEHSEGCGGATEYPMISTFSFPGSEMTPEQYHQMSDEPSLAWSSIVDIYDVLLDGSNPNDALNQVKASLSAGDRLTFGVLFPSLSRGVMGAVGRYKAANDSWLLTPEIIEDMQTETDFPGHEMIITGFDDDAVAIDDHGRSYKGLLTLRNSWGARVGDQGNFYMSYDYFKTLTIEVQRIRHGA
jgi:hypothetical protein